MRRAAFLRFSASSIALMLLLLALPMAMTLWLSVRTCTPELELVAVEMTGPFAAQQVITQRQRLDEAGRPRVHCHFVGLQNYRKVLGLEDPAKAEKVVGAEKPAEKTAKAAEVDNRSEHNEFLDALGFTLLYTLATTPFILGGGLALALAMNQVTQRLKGAFIAASLLPFIITPVVGALAIKWLFRDNGLVSSLLAEVGVQVFWMAQAWSARLLIIVYGIWHVLPFAFIVFYAGLQSVPQDSLEAATLDGANRWQKLRYVTLPHLAPLVVFVTLIHLMDAYRVFEPVLVLTKGAFTTSVQYLTYTILLEESNPYKASAAAVLTLVGIGVLLVPLLRRTWREQRGGQG
jgi:multiple sugar transport system permease protein